MRSLITLYSEVVSLKCYFQYCLDKFLSFVCYIVIESEITFHPLLLSGELKCYFTCCLDKFLCFGLLYNDQNLVGNFASKCNSQGRNADSLSQYFGEDPARCPFEQGLGGIRFFCNFNYL